MTSLHHFPEYKDLEPEIQHYILLGVTYRDILSYCSTSRAARKICEDDFFWKKKIQQDFGDIFTEAKAGVFGNIPAKNIGEWDWHNEYRSYLKSAGNDFVFLARNGDLNGVKEYLRLGVNINSVSDRNGETGVMAIVKTRFPHKKMLNWLLENGADPNIPDKGGYTPLMRCKGVEIMRLLLKYGANPKAKDQTGAPLIMKISDISPMKLLLDIGVDPNEKNADGFTSLWGAIIKGDVEMVELLLNYGADIYVKSNLGDSPAHLPKRMQAYGVMRGIMAKKYRTIFSMIQKKMTKSRESKEYSPLLPTIM